MAADFSELIQWAINASDKAYAPYSQYPVGAALMALDGTIFTGCNVENAAYPACICAERTALVKAISEGARQFSTIAVATQNAGAPCGTCRQMLYEFAPDLRVLIVDFSGAIKVDTSLRELLPYGFGSDNLPK